MKKRIKDYWDANEFSITVGVFFGIIIGIVVLIVANV